MTNHDFGFKICLHCVLYLRLTVNRMWKLSFVKISYKIVNQAEWQIAIVALATSTLNKIKKNKGFCQIFRNLIWYKRHFSPLIIMIIDGYFSVFDSWFMFPWTTKYGMGGWYRESTGEVTKSSNPICLKRENAS